MEMKKYPNITVLETQFNEDDANKAAAQLQAVYARNPDLAGVFGANLFSASGAATGVKQANAQGKIRVVAFDAPQSIVADIKAGNIDIAITQHPAEIGFYGVVTAYAHLSGQSVPPLIGTGFTVIDKSNVDDPNVKKFIYSDLSCNSSVGMLLLIPTVSCAFHCCSWQTITAATRFRG